MVNECGTCTTVYANVEDGCIVENFMLMIFKDYIIMVIFFLRVTRRYEE